MPCSSSTSRNTIPLAEAGRCRATASPARAHRRPVGQILQVGRGHEAAGGEAGPQLRERVRAHAEPGRPVVGDELLPLAEGGQPRRLADLDVERELMAAAHGDGVAEQAELPVQLASPSHPVAGAGGDQELEAGRSSAVRRARSARSR